MGRVLEAKIFAGSREAKTKIAGSKIKNQRTRTMAPVNRQATNRNQIDGLSRSGLELTLGSWFLLTPLPMGDGVSVGGIR